MQGSRNTEILGAEFMKPDSKQKDGVASQNRLVRDQLVGKQVVIISGKFKGHRGRVTFADDNTAKVELSSQCKVLPVDKHSVKELSKLNEDQSGQANAEGRSIYGG